MNSAGRTARRLSLRSRVSRPALIVVAVVVLALAVLWATGGLRTAPASGVRTFPVGVEIDLQRWTLVVQRVELANTDISGSPQQTTIRVWLQATFTGQRSIYGLGAGLVDLEVPGGPAPGPDPADVRVEGYSGGFDPGVQRPLVMDFTWPAEEKPGDEKTQPKVPRVPERVNVVISDERKSDSYLDSDSWVNTRPIGYVSVPCTDVRK